MTKPIPDGYHTLTPYLVVSDAAKAIEFYQRAFGAEERYRAPGPDGRIWHAEVQVGDSVLMLSDALPEHGGAPAPEPNAQVPASLHVYVVDADAAFAKAVEAGCEAAMPMMDAPWGDRYGRVRDPFGHEWAFATHVRDVDPASVDLG